MKCKYCNASVTLEDEYCPYCGALNVAARQHIADMKKFEQDYSKTKSEVLEHATRQSQRHAHLMAVIILVVVNVVFFVLNAMSDNLQDLVERGRLNRNAAAYEAELSTLEANGSYAQMEYLYNRSYLYEVDALDDYSAVVYVANEYDRAMGYMYYLSHPEVVSYLTDSDILNYLSSSVAYMYEEVYSEVYEYNQDQFSDQHLAAMEEMISNTEAMLMTYCNLTEEDIERLPDMESAEILVLLGRRLGIYEE